MNQKRVDDLERARFVLRLHARAQQVVYEALQFPTVSVRWPGGFSSGRGGEVRARPRRRNGQTIDTDAMCAARSRAHAATVPMSHVGVSFGVHPGREEDLRAREGSRRARGSSTAINRSALPKIDVVRSRVAFAVGGSVKYMCGGAGAAWYTCEDLIASSRRA